MSDFNDIAFGDLLYLVDVNRVGWYVVRACYWDIGIKRVGLIEDESITIDITPQRMYMVQKHIRAAAVPGAIEALERIEMTAGQPAMDDDPVRVRARAALRAVRGEETK